MTRNDDKMGFLLKYENVAWYEKGKVRILDRRVYPYKKEFVICSKYKEVAKAIKDMVTQSGGPFTACAMGMALASYECRDEGELEQLDFLTKAAYDLSHARPTTSAKMVDITNACLNVAKKALSEDKLPVEAVFQYAYNELEKRYATYHKVAKHLVSHFPKNGTVMTMCFAETILGTMLVECEKTGKTPRFICPETRPYLQGARLTASVISDMGFETYVITDNMPLYIMEQEKVDLFTSAADVITMDGYVVNKIGTSQIALCANHLDIPYFVTGSPNKHHENIKTVTIENRDTSQVTDMLGTRLVEENVQAFYPAFDIVKPKFVSGVVTKKGVFSPYELEKYFNE